MKKIFLLCSMILIFSSISYVFATEEEVRFGERPWIDLFQVPDEAMEKGWITIKFHTEYTDHLDNLQITRDEDGIVLTGITAIDELNRRFEVHTVRRLFESPALKNEFEWRHRLWGFHLWYELRFDSIEDIRKIITAYRDLNEIIAWAEPEYKKSLLSDHGNPRRWTTNDPFLHNQWHYHNTGQEAGTPGADISLFNAWNMEQGSTDVIVAVIDDGIMYNHVDLAGNMWPGIGYNFVNDNSTIYPSAHGTHVAGTVAAISNNAIGVAGIAGGSGTANGVRLISCQIFRSSLSGGFALAPVYAADNNAAISQNSWGYSTMGYYEQSVLDAIDYFNINGGGDVLNGGITIFAAGNENSSGLKYPACYSGTFSVAATNNQDQKAYYSNYDTWVDISAPGGEVNQLIARGVMSTILSNSYNYSQGTSMACPHASGVAALIISYAYRNSTILNTSDVANILRNSTDDHYPLNPGYLNMLGTGRLNAHAALLATQTMLAVVPNPQYLTATTLNASEINLSWAANVFNDNVMLAWSTDGVFGIPVNGTEYSAGEIIMGGGLVIYRGDATTYNHTALEEGVTYYYKAFSYDSNHDYSSGIAAEAVTSAEQIVEIGFGTTTNNANAAAPININRRSLRGQMVYTTAEISAAGFEGSGTITHLGFYVVYAPQYSLPNFIVRMKHTTEVDASLHDVGPYETVYTNTLYAPVIGGWDMLELVVPFQWNGIDNILVDTAFSRTQAASSTGQQRIFDSTNGFRYTRSHDFDQTNEITTEITDYKPQIRFIMITSGTDDVETPQHLSIIIDDGWITISWDVVETADSYVVEASNSIENGFIDISTEGIFTEEDNRVIWIRALLDDQMLQFFRVKGVRDN